jgi:hypothetical protein
VGGSAWGSVGHLISGSAWGDVGGSAWGSVGHLISLKPSKPLVTNLKRSTVRLGASDEINPVTNCTSTGPAAFRLLVG